MACSKSTEVATQSSHSRNKHPTSSHPRRSHSRSSHPRSNHSRNKQLHKKGFVHSIRMLNLSLNELKLIVAKSRGIKGYKSMSEDKLTKILSGPESKTSKNKT